MKRLLLSAFFALFLVFGLIVVSPVVFATEESSDPVLRIVLNGVTYELSYSADSTWDDLLHDGAVYLSNGYSVQWTTDDGYIAADIIDTDGNRHQYWLVDAASSSVGEFITTEHTVFNSVPYLTTVGIEIGTSDGVYLFEYPSYLRTWEDVIAEGVYNHSSLGSCQWVANNGYIALNTSIDIKPVLYVPDRVANPDEQTDAFFAVGSSVFQYGVARAGRWLFVLDHVHSLEVFSKREPDCINPGYCHYVCANCTYGEYVKLAPVGHSFSVVDCYTPMTCTVCGLEEGDPVGHDFPIVGQCRRDGCTAYTGQDVVEDAGGAIGKWWDTATDAVGGFFKNLPQKLGEAVDGGIDWVKERGENAGIGDGINSVLLVVGAFAGLSFFGVLILLFLKIKSKIKSK